MDARSRGVRGGLAGAPPGRASCLRPGLHVRPRMSPEYTIFRMSGGGDLDPFDLHVRPTPLDRLPLRAGAGATGGAEREVGKLGSREVGK